jgi:hypothetical protein
MIGMDAEHSEEGTVFVFLTQSTTAHNASIEITEKEIRPWIGDRIVDLMNGGAISTDEMGLRGPSGRSKRGAVGTLDEFDDVSNIAKFSESIGQSMFGRDRLTPAQ